ncbi:hypothetical protein RRF57_011379 [Xylaria bambusicola]|uniref:Uncharacterized protein n=1 Tax=Xylaria bambusicola TaxID=326684 RepID=A0AAN7UTP7_9PEZI
MKPYPSPWLALDPTANSAAMTMVPIAIPASPARLWLAKSVAVRDDPGPSAILPKRPWMDWGKAVPRDVKVIPIGVCALSA